MRIAYIDAASLEQAISDLERSLGVKSIPFEHRMFFDNLGAERVFYYDALPSSKSSESKEDYDRRLAEKEEKLNAIRMVRRTTVRLGMTKRDGTGSQRQKGVDVFLATDALRHAYEKTSNHATFVLSDLDFYPVFETLSHTSVMSALFYRVGHTAEELLQVAANASPLTQSFLLRSCEPNFAAQFSVVETGENGPLSDEEAKLAVHGSHLGREIAIWPKAKEPGFVVWFSGIRSEAKSRELGIERWIPATSSDIVFSDGWVYRARCK